MHHVFRLMVAGQVSKRVNVVQFVIRVVQIGSPKIIWCQLYLVDARQLSVILVIRTASNVVSVGCHEPQDNIQRQLDIYLPTGIVKPGLSRLDFYHDVLE